MYLALAIIVVWSLSGLAVYFVGYKFFPKSLVGFGAGQIGDMFGAVNSLFAGLAFAGLIFTMLMQKDELSLQREELILQRKIRIEANEESKRAANAQELSARVSGISTVIATYGARIRYLDEYNKLHAEAMKRYEAARPENDQTAATKEDLEPYEKELINEREELRTKMEKLINLVKGLEPKLTGLSAETR